MKRTTILAAVAALRALADAVEAEAGEVDAASADELLPLDVAADIAGVRRRVLVDAGNAKGERRLDLLGPRGRRVVRRSELLRWMSVPSQRKASASNDGAADARAQARAAVARMAGAR